VLINFPKISIFLWLHPYWSGVGGVTPSLPFCLSLYSWVCCFFYKYELQYFWISLSLCLLLIVVLPCFCTPPTTLFSHMSHCFRFMETQESAKCH
jgi:hypothetical protein